MFGWTEIFLLLAAVVLLLCGARAPLRPYRSLFWGGSILMLITALFPRPGNPLGQFLFGPNSAGLHLPPELFGIAWWILGAWLVKSVFDLILRRTIFPDNDEPHARRLFADLASALIYVLAFVGIVDTVLKQPISAVLATSGVLAIVLGLALQNTLADVFSGLAINIERPFGAGDWITVTDDVRGQVMEINWRATLIRTLSNDMIVIPNSVVANAIVTNHCRPSDPHLSVLRLAIDHTVPPAQVIGTLQAAATACPEIASSSPPKAYAREFSGALIAYELAFAIADFALIRNVRSELIRRVADALRENSVMIGGPAMEVRLVQQDDVAASAAGGGAEPVALVSPAHTA
ncbi:MAG TPA: mechanosensitive ion channel family protein [Bradyrhizobium sp.]|nr:mechanosensitive ion channel family protein [Bradyrhizobium sp.]